MKKLKFNIIIPALALGALFAGCGDPGRDSDSTGNNDPATEEEHEHEEIVLGTFDIEGITIDAAQGHGNIEAGKEGHLVIKLPYNDSGETTVRAWIGTADRTLSAAGKGEYAPSHDDYDIHAVAPDPLPAGADWWVEIEKPDGTKAVGSFPLLEEIPQAE